MLHEYTEASSFTKKYLIKRQALKEQATMQESSIFRTLSVKQTNPFTPIEPLKKYQTLTTNIEQSCTLQTVQDALSSDGKMNRSDVHEILPKISLASQGSRMKKTVLQTLGQGTEVVRMKEQYLTHHVSDPLYSKLEKSISKRVHQKFDHYQRGWIKSCIRRKEKSVIERSLEKADESIAHINLDARKRRNTTHLEEIVRNNIAEKTFIFPGRLRPEIEGLKGKGGKAVGLHKQMYQVEQVYKIDRSK